MRARIHRGTNQIGGSVVELEHEGDRIVLDLGTPLEPVAYRDLLPDVNGLWSTGDGSLKGVFITHGHPDHYGLVDLIDPAVPIFMGKAAKSLIDEAAFFTRRDPSFRCAGFLEDGAPIRVGDFRVTPMLVDHSGFDAYGLLVQAGGESIFYTGDIRFHGRKSHRMRYLANRLPEDLGCMLMEGTNFDRPTRPDGPETEQELEDHLASSFQGVEGVVLCFYSAQNIDRLVTVFRAAKKSGRILVLDLYGATIAKATGKTTIPQPGWDGIRVYVREMERRQVKISREFERVHLPSGSRIFRDEIAEEPSRFVISARGSSISELGRDQCLEGAGAFWSQWAGYLERDRDISSVLERFSVEIDLAHVSGHATANDLTDFATRVNADQTTLIHTKAPNFLAGQLPSHQRRNDGEWWPVGRHHE